MASNPLVLSDPNLLAEFVRESEFKSFFEKRFAAPPDLAALLFRNGQLIDTYKGAHFSVGGIVNALKGAVGGDTHIAIMLADLKPFQIKLPLEAMSKDNVRISGVATLELQLNPEKPANILGLMGGVNRREQDQKKGQGETSTTQLPGRKALTRSDVLERIAPHFSDRVIEAVIGRMDAVDIRGETGLQDKIQADMMKEAERVCGDLGLLVRAVSVTWAMNDAEREAFDRARLAREQDALDYQLDLLQREVARQADATEFTIKTKLDLAKLESASEDELAQMVLKSEVEFLDAREMATRRQEMQALAHEIEILRTERAAKMENDLSEAGHLTDLTKEAARLRDTERNIELLDARHIAEMKKVGVLTDLELNERQQRMELEIARMAQKQSAENLKTLMELEGKTKDGDVQRDILAGKAQTEQDISRMKAEADARTSQLQAGAKMTPEQILAINAGLSSDVADVLKEQARANAASDDNTMETMRDLVKGAAEERQSLQQQELDRLNIVMKGATGIAFGAGGKSDVPNDPGGLDPTSTVECPECGRILKATAKYCTGCGHKMRT